jgi:hypothetical protein
VAAASYAEPEAEAPHGPSSEETGFTGPLGAALPPVEADVSAGRVEPAASDRAWLDTLDWDGDLLIEAPAAAPEQDDAAEVGSAAEEGIVPEAAAPVEQDADRSEPAWLEAEPELAEALTDYAPDERTHEEGAAENDGEPDAVDIAELLVTPDHGAAGEAGAEPMDVAEDESPGDLRRTPAPAGEERSADESSADESGVDAKGAEPPAAVEPHAAAAAAAAIAEASAGLAKAPNAMPEAFAGVFDEVADRLDNIADSMRRRSRGDAAAGRSSDPLELLLTGFVLGYVARQGNDPEKRGE